MWGTRGATKEKRTRGKEKLKEGRVNSGKLQHERKSMQLEGGMGVIQPQTRITQGGERDIIEEG